MIDEGNLDINSLMGGLKEECSLLPVTRRLMSLELTTEHMEWLEEAVWFFINFACIRFEEKDIDHIDRHNELTKSLCVLMTRLQKRRPGYKPIEEFELKRRADIL